MADAVGQTGGHSTLEDEERYGSPVDFSRLVKAILQSRKWLVGGLLLGALISLPIAKFAMPRSFEATAIMKFEGLPVIEGIAQPAEQNVGGMLQAIQIQSVLRRVSEDMGYDLPLNELGARINYNVDSANMVRVVGGESTGEGAARLANTVVDAFLQHRLETARSRIQNAVDSVDERLTAATAASMQAQSVYDSFRERNGITNLSTEQETALESAAELRAERDSTVSQIAALEARVEQLGRDLARTPRSVGQSSSSSASPEAQQLSRLQAELNSARSSLSEGHPRVQALQQQVVALQARIVSKMSGRIHSHTSGSNATHSALQMALSTARADLGEARQQLEGLTTRAADAQRRVEQFSSLEGEASQLLAAVRVNQTLTQDLQSQKMRMEDALRDPSTGFSIISEASAPPFPLASKARYVVAAGIPALFVLLALFFFIGRELRGFRIQTANEVAFWGKGPVIGTSVWPRDPHAIDDLIADMDDFVPEAQGQMLVLSADGETAELAERFAARLNSDWNDTTLVGTPLFDEDQPSQPRISLPSGLGSTAPLPGSDTILSIATPIAMDAIIHRSPALPVVSRGHHLDLDAAQAVGRMHVEAWTGPQQGQALRRAARLADRVCVIVPAGKVTFSKLSEIRTRIGRKHGVGYVLVDVHERFEDLIDRVGPVEQFWISTRE